MLSSGDAAPSFSLPGAHRDAIDTFALEDYEGRIVVLAFYPMDFSPACRRELKAFREMELFSIADAVDLLAISADSAYAHRAFAREYDLDFPLLSDRTGEVAAQYGVLADEIEGHENVPRRSVFVIDAGRTIRYAWSTDDPSVVPEPEAIRDAVESIRDDDIAQARFEDGRSEYTFGRSELENGMEALDEACYELAANTLEESAWYFEEAMDAFDQAARYAEDRGIEEATEIAAEKAREYRQAAEWFMEAAQRREQGERSVADDIEDDARDALERARQYPPMEDLAGK